MKLPYTTAMKLMAVLDKRMDVNGLVWQGVHLWPYLRMNMYGRVVDYAESALSPDAAAVIERIDVAFADAYDRPSAPSPYAYDNASVAIPPLPGGRDAALDVVLLTRAHEHFQATPRGFVSPINDAAFEVFSRARRGAKLEVEPVPPDTAFEPRSIAGASMAAAPGAMQRLAAESLSASHRRLLKTILETWKISVEEACADLIGTRDVFEGVEAHGTSFAEQLLGDTLALTGYRLLFDGVLERLRPRCAIVHSFSYDVPMGLIWSAHARGIRVVNLQHGLIGDLSFAYSHWTRVPDGGYTLFPDVFLGWGAQSASEMAQWLDSGGRGPWVLDGGRPDHALFAPGGELHRPFGFGAEVDAPHRVLVPIDSMLVGLSMEVLIEAMRVSAGDILWLIRFHPFQGALRDRVLARFAAEGLRNFEHERTSSHPLWSVLAAATHHVTEASSIVVEAQYMDVPTTFLYRRIGDVMGAFIDAGRAYVASDAEELLASIRAGWTGLRRQSNADMISTDAAHIAAVRDAVMNEPGSAR